MWNGNSHAIVKSPPPISRTHSGNGIVDWLDSTRSRRASPSSFSRPTAES